MAKRRGITFAFPFCILGDFLRKASGEVCPKEAVACYVSRAGSVGGDWRLLKSAVALVRLLSVEDFNSTIETKQAA